MRVPRLGPGFNTHRMPDNRWKTASAHDVHQNLLKQVGFG